MQRSRSRRNVLVVVAAVAALAALPYSHYRRDMQQAWARVSTGSRIVTSPCGQIEYAERGQGPAVLVVHGAGGGFDQGMDLSEGLVQAGFRVIAPSRFGYLRTPLPADASVEAQARAHACLLDALGIPRAAIMGVSAGGPSALQFASQFPERTRALVLLVPAAFGLDPNRRPAPRASRATLLLFDSALRSDFLFWAGSRLAHDTFVRAILGTPPALLAGASPEERARVEATLAHILPVSPRRAGLLNDGLIVSAAAPYQVARVTAPTLAISTEDDAYGTYAAARAAGQRLSHARFVGYPDGGHLLVGRNAAAAAEIVAFLREAAER